MSESMTMIRMNDPRRGLTGHREEIEAALARVLDSGWFILGPEVDALECELAEVLGVRHVVLVGSGTDALQLALAAAGVSRGSNVYTVANAGGYTTAAALALGAVPRYVDVDPVTLLMDVDSLERAVRAYGSKPDAIVVTHLYGSSAPVDDIVAWASERSIRVIEDVAQAFGGVRGDRPLGSIGDLGITSFYPTKNLAALGDGGAVFTSDDAMAGTIRRLRQYGWSSKYVVDDPRGRNSRMDEMQAAVVRARLPLLRGSTQRRLDIHRQLEGAAAHAGIRTVGNADGEFVGHLAVIVVPDRDASRAHLTKLGVGSDIHYPVPDHRQPYVSSTMTLPHTEFAADHVLSVPLFPELTEAEVERICSAVSTIPS